MWKFNNEKPIYIQLVEQIYFKIITNEYKPGEKIPSVRDLASETKTNPNTIQKALLEIENMGLIETKRTNGKFITEDSNLINKYKKDFINNKINNLINDLSGFNLSIDEIIELIKDGLK